MSFPDIIPSFKALEAALPLRHQKINKNKMKRIAFHLKLFGLVATFVVYGFLKIHLAIMALSENSLFLRRTEKGKISAPDHLQELTSKMEVHCFV